MIPNFGFILKRSLYTTKFSRAIWGIFSQNFHGNFQCHQLSVDNWTCLAPGNPSTQVVPIELLNPPISILDRWRRCNFVHTWCTVTTSTWMCIVGVWFNTLGPRQHKRCFAEDIFKCIFFNEYCCILIKISLKFVRKGPIDNNPALVQIMAWRRRRQAIFWTNDG